MSGRPWAKAQRGHAGKAGCKDGDSRRFWYCIERGGGDNRLPGGRGMKLVPEQITIRRGAHRSTASIKPNIAWISNVLQAVGRRGGDRVIQQAERIQIRQGDAGQRGTYSNIP